jgi:hypothetical protein
MELPAGASTPAPAPAPLPIPTPTAGIASDGIEDPEWVDMDADAPDGTGG